MAEEFIVDMTKARRRKKRSRRSISRYWNPRYTAFLNAGFTEQEASWGANKGLSLRNKKVKEIIKHRRALVDLYMGSHYRFSRDKAIKMAAKDLKSKLKDANITELNLYFEVSP